MIPTMENKPLYIPASKKWKGLKVFCYKCKTSVSEICKTSGKPLWQCKNGDKHVFKVIIHVPGTNNQRRTKKLETRDINEAIKQAIEFERQAKSEAYQENKNKALKHEINKEDQSQNRPYLLIQALARYIGWLNNEGVPAHLIKIRSREHIKDVERALKSLAECLKDNRYNLATCLTEDIDNQMVGVVFSSLEKRKLAPRTFNKYFSYYTSFLKWYAEEYDCPIRNYFEKVKRKNLNPKPEAITFQEYQALLKQITPENGIREYKNGVKPTRNLFRPWLADGIRLALETGRRREEIINLKWKDIQESNGIQYIKVEDYKVNRIQNRISDEEKKFIYIPVTASLRKLLDELNPNKSSKIDDYILAPEVKIKRGKVMSDVLSRGFTHYYDQLNTGRKLTFKCLRKTYITNLEIFMGIGNTKVITGHSADQVIERNYIDKKEIAKAAHGFRVFSAEEERDQELQEFRIAKKNNIEQRNPEV
ncbi:MAG: tyrosine-type recombinase/integrase [Lentimicrobiaceae bacterium]|nr:tyrosine-type recombinase/integrase [Lentimicrobiaceae bacterium]